MRIYTLAVALDGLGRKNESLPVWQNLMNEQDRLVARYPDNAKQVGNFANTLRVMSLAARDRGDLAEAVKLCQRSVQVRPDEHNRKLLAELAGQTVTPVASTESKPVTRPPQRFRFDYKYTDPGSRYWVKEGLRWVETLPSGSQNVYEIAGPVMVNGVPGTEIRRLGSVKLTLFVPDLGAEKVPWLRMVEPSGKWGGVGPILDLE